MTVAKQNHVIMTIADNRKPVAILTLGLLGLSPSHKIKADIV